MRTILIMTDFSPAARAAADAGLAIARVLEAGILLLNSYHLPQVILAKLPGKDYLALEAESKAKLEGEKSRLLNTINSSVEIKKIMVKVISSIEPISEVLYDIQQGNKIVLCIMGKHKRSKNSFIFANHIHLALSNNNCPLLIMSHSKFKADGLRANFASDLDVKDLKLISRMHQLAKAFNSSLSISHVLDESGFIADFNQEDRLKSFSLALEATGFQGVGLRLLEGSSMVAEEEKLMSAAGYDLLILVNRRHKLLHELFHSSHCKAFIKKQKHPILVMSEDWGGNYCFSKNTR